MNFLFLDTLGYESAIRLSGHHYARLLGERGHRVLSLSAPVTPFHWLARGAQRATIRRRFEAHRRGFSPAPTGVLHYVPFSLIPVRKHFPFDRPIALRLAERTWAGDVMRRLRELNFSPDVISLQNMMFYPFARRFPDAVLQYRMTDLMSGFTDLPRSMLQYEDRVLDEADIVSITSMQFAFKLEGRNASKLLYAPNGVDADHMSRPRPRPEAYAAIDRPIAVYVGALRAWFDWDLVRHAVESAPEIQFVIISPDAPRADMLNHKNFTYIPGVPYEEIPAYYQHAAAGIVPFKDSPLVAPVNPIKLFECLAAGTPVAAIEWAELRTQIEAPIHLAKTPEQFTAALKSAIAEKGAIDYRPYLKNRSWQGNLDALLERIERVRSERGLI